MDGAEWWRLASPAWHNGFNAAVSGGRAEVFLEGQLM
jgi:hypothetical protein